MAVQVLTNASITIGSTDLSSYANSVSLNYEIDQVEATAFGGNHSFIGGLQNNSCEITFNQDYAATKVEATIFPLVGTQVSSIVIIPVNGAVSATNPRYTLSNAYLAAHTPVAGKVGELVTTTLTFTGGTLVKASV
jgi:3D (Asp-Asp-Asp) domain-containing protein